MPEDIPEGGVWPPANNEPPQRKGVKDYLNKFYTEEWLFALVSLGFTFGWSVSGFPPSIILACSCWMVTIAVLLHYFWVWSRKLKLHRWISVWTIICFCFIIVLFSWKPVKAQYIAEHSPPPPTPTEATLINGVGQIEGTLTNKPSVELYVTYPNPTETNIVMLKKDHQIIEQVNITTIQVVDVLSSATNNSVDLGKSRDINLGIVVFGDGIVDGIEVQLFTPWMDDGNNLTGEGGYWRDMGRVDLMDTQTHTYNYSHCMTCSMDIAMNPRVSVPMPRLHIPGNYTNNVLYTILRIDSKSTYEKYLKVAFHLN